MPAASSSTAATVQRFNYFDRRCSMPLPTPSWTRRRPQSARIAKLGGAGGGGCSEVRVVSLLSWLRVGCFGGYLGVILLPRLHVRPLTLINRTLRTAR